MEYDQFLHQVMQKAGLKTTGEGQRLIRAVTETLGERLGDHEQHDLQAQLPREMKGWIHQTDNGEAFPLDQFYDRVAHRADLTYDQAIDDTRIVLGLLRQSVSWGQVRDILETLPEDYRLAFDMKSPHAA